MVRSRRSSRGCAPRSTRRNDTEDSIMKWVTRANVHVDRVACPWLIKKVVDHDAEFLFVPAGQVMAAAAPGALPPHGRGGVGLGHHGAEGAFDPTGHDYKHGP